MTALKSNLLFENALSALKYHAEHQPEATAFKLIDSFGSTTEQATYQQIWQRTLTLAQHVSLHCKAGDRVLLLYQNGIEVVCALLACMASQTIAVPCATLKKSLNTDTISALRLTSIIKNAEPELILCSSQQWYELVKPNKIGRPAWQGTTILDTESIESCPSLCELNLHDIAYLQYTSGTTGQAKGVIITHKNLSNNINQMTTAANAGEHPRFHTAVNWLPYHHDMGLINSILMPLYAGNLSIILSPFSFLKNPLVWLHTISQYPAVTSGGPGFCYDHCCRRLSSQQIEQLDLSTWTLAYVGSESIRPQQIQRFCEQFACTGFKPTAFHPCYGLAETVVHACGDWRFEGIKSLTHPLKPRNQQTADEIQLTNVGKPFSDHCILIVDPKNRQVLPESRIGEVWIKGPSLTKGYWNNAELNSKLFDQEIKNHGTGFFRTGDLGFKENGDFYISGRMKDLIIIRGNNIFPEDIEWLVIEHIKAIRHGQVVAITVTNNHGDEQLVVLIQQSPGLNEQSHTLLQDIYQHLLNQLGIKIAALYLIQSPALTTTTSGKLNRHYCQKQFQQGRYHIQDQYFSQ